MCLLNSLLVQLEYLFAYLLCTETAGFLGGEKFKFFPSYPPIHTPSPGIPLPFTSSKAIFTSPHLIEVTKNT